jgi:hypothetical protein
VHHVTLLVQGVGDLMGQRWKTIVGFAVIIGGAYLFSNAKKPADPNECGSRSMAFVMSQEFVKKRMKVPSTASFPWITADGVTVDERAKCEFRVSAYVDAENSFGAKLRTAYRVALKYTSADENWHLTDITM